MIKQTARTELAEPDRLRFVADELERQFAKKKPKRFLRIGGGPFMAIMDFGDRKEVWTDHAIDCRMRSLPDLHCFCIKKSPHAHVNDIQISTESTHPGARDKWRQWFVEHGQAMPRALLDAYLVAPDRTVAPSSDCSFIEKADYTVGICIDAKQGIQTQWQYWPNDGDGPANFERFFKTCITGCDLEGEIRTEHSEKGFRLASDRLKLSFGHAKWGDYDPQSIYIQAPNMSTALRWCDLSISSLSAEQIGQSVYIECGEAQYSNFRLTWNDLGLGWQMRLKGGFVPGFDPFTAPLPTTGEAPVSYPLLYWEAGGEDLYYQCNVVAGPEGRYLELLTNVTSEKKVKERLTKVNAALRFQIVPVQC